MWCLKTVYFKLTSRHQEADVFCTYFKIRPVVFHSITAKNSTAVHKSSVKLWTNYTQGQF